MSFEINNKNPFKICSRLGLYPVVESSSWIEMLLPLGVKTIQLRIKDPHKNLESEIIKSIELAKYFGATLFINDYWELALKHGAEGIHLGQSDLDTADIESIRAAGVLLGVSTLSSEEVKRACAIQPSYIACGPVYPTTSKIMSAAPQGIEQLTYWRRTLNYPLVAIGGITLQRVPEVLATGVEGIALISAITEAPDPIVATCSLLALIEKATCNSTE